MQILLQTEEDFARFQRRLHPWLPDNIVEDKLTRLRYLETGKMIASDIQLTRMVCRCLAKMSAEEKQKVQESLRWSVYDPKLRSDVIHLIYADEFADARVCGIENVASAARNVRRFECRTIPCAGPGVCSQP